MSFAVASRVSFLEDRICHVTNPKPIKAASTVGHPAISQSWTFFSQPIIFPRSVPKRSPPQYPQPLGYKGMGTERGGFEPTVRLPVQADENGRQRASAEADALLAKCQD